jgi:tetratricopeptide (TPR) repeat protein
VEQIRSIEACLAAVPPGSVTEAGLLRYLAEAKLAAGQFSAAVETAVRAVDSALALPGKLVRRRIDAWTTLGHAQSLSAVSGKPDVVPYEEALRLCRSEALSRSLASIRLNRLVCRELSAGGDFEAARERLEGQLVRTGSGTRKARRETLRLETELAIIAFRRAQVDVAIATLEEIAQRQERLLSALHADRLTTRHNLGVALRRATRHAEALELFENVAAQRDVVLGRSHPNTLVTRSFLSLQRAEAGKARAEIPVITAILEEARQSLSERHPFVFEIASRCASVLEQAGCTAELCDFLADWSVRAHNALGAGHSVTESMQHAYGGALRNAGRLHEAYGIYGELAEATRAEKGDAHIDTLASVNNLAVVASDLGDSDRAEGLYRAMLGEFDHLGPTFDRDKASVRTNLAHLLLAKGELEEAHALFDAVLETRARLMPPGARLIELSRSNVAASLSALGRYDEAIRLHREVLETRTRLYGEVDIDRLASLHNLGTTLTQAGRPQDGIPLLEEAVRLRGRVLGNRHYNTVASMRALADALSGSGRTEDAEALLLELIGIVEEQRTAPGIPDDLRRKFYALYVPFYRELGFLAARANKVERVFEISELVKARTLVERIAGDERMHRLRLSADQRVELRRLERDLAAQEARISDATDAYERSAAIVERDRIERRLDQRVVELTSGATGGFGLPGTIDFARAAQLLTADEAMLSFLVQRDRVCVVWLTGWGERGVLELSGLPGLSGRIATLGTLLSKSADRAAAGTPSVAAVEELSACLVGQLPDAVTRCHRLVIVPDGCLATVPFEVLRVRGRRLVETHEIRYVPSMSFAELVAAREARRATPYMPLLAIGNPALAHCNAANGAASNSPLQVALRSARGDERTSWAPLPGAARELAMVEQLYGLEEGQSLHTLAAASVQHVRDLSEDGTLLRAKALLFSTHGYLDPVDPNRSGIVLAAGENEENVIRASEISSWELACDLVFLSACDTGRAQFQSGEGLLGVPLAFMMAGSRANVQTLWPIHDAASAVFVARFFELYRECDDAAAALTAVKREFLAGQHGADCADAAYWAPFLLYGFSVDRT